MKGSLSKSIFNQHNILLDLVNRPNFWFVLMIDCCLIIVAHILAYFVRFDFIILTKLDKITSLIPLALAIKIPVFYFFGLYRGMWRYTSISDLINIAKAVIFSSGLIIMVVLYFNRFEGFSRSIFFMDGVFSFLLICIHRGTIRYLLQNINIIKKFKKNKESPRSQKRLLVIGAGAAGEKVLREIRDNQHIPFKVVGLVDDDPEKQGLKIHKIPVIGKVNDLLKCVTLTSTEELLIAISSASSEQMKRIVEYCRNTELPFKVLPSIGEIINGKLSVSSIRDVDYRDLLGRPVVKLDQKAIGAFLSNRTILVTGAGGSIGSELCRQITRFNPQKIILIDAGEENLYNIQMTLHHELSFTNYIPVLAKIQNKSLIEAVFNEYNPSVVFHAAAYKHVPLIETNPWEAIFNNVVGTKNLIETAISHKTERFVLVSTDKAVRPANVMGASKRLSELLMLANCKRDGYTTFMAVRFGNVLGSSGSVIPLFKRQIEQGGPVTVTNPEVTRFFMSIEEAAQLTLQAGAMGRGKEIFILKMGKPIKILDVAKEFITLMGYIPEKDIKIIFTGLRPGEKGYEELTTEDEGTLPTNHEKIMVLKGSGAVRNDQEQLLDRLNVHAEHYDAHAIKETLKMLIPEYTPDYQAVPVININKYNINNSDLRN